MIRVIGSIVASVGIIAVSLGGPPAHDKKPSTSDKHADDFGIFRPSEIKWQEAPPSLPPGAKIALLEGDPAKEGPFVVRFLLPDGYRVMPHTHPKMERATII